MVTQDHNDLINPATTSTSLPVFVAADGVRLRTNDGRTFLDFASGFEAANANAVQGAMAEHLRTAHYYGDAESRYLEDLIRVVPAGLTHVHPTRDGSEATEVALSACMRYRQAKTFLAFRGGYHGSTLGALCVSHSKRGQELLEISAPSAEFVDFPLGHEHSAACVAKAVRAITSRAPSAPTLAGIIVEPIQACAGIRVPPQTFLPTLAKAARSQNIPLIVDEIYTGFGRTGRAFACAISGVTPDLLLMGHGMGSGLPGGAVAGRADILASFPATPHRLHPMTASACITALRYALDNDVWSKAGAIEHWFEPWRQRFETHLLVENIQGLGAMFGIELKLPEGMGRRELAADVRSAILRQGLLVWECGIDSVVIGLIPPFMVDETDVNAACEMVLAALDCVLSAHRR